MKKILVTGAAGFIGFHLCKLLIQKGFSVLGLDNINDYYDPNLKFDRLEILGIKKNDSKVFNLISSKKNFSFIRTNLEDKQVLNKLFKDEKFDVVCNLAAQAGVRYSLLNPEAYINSNITGFLNILECCRYNNINHLIYASSSSVYGLNKNVPFSIYDQVDKPISLYASSKKSNELMAHTYSHLFNIPCTGLRFFTVYGPWGRPDMALFLFTKAILEGNEIEVYNYGNMKRDFTYVDDIVLGVYKIIIKGPKSNFNLYNIGNNSSVDLMDFIEAIENKIQKKAKKKLLPIQPGDVSKTWACVEKLVKDYDYKPSTKINYGISKFIDWYINYYKINEKL